MSWHKLTKEEQDAKLEEFLPLFARRPELYPGSWDAWKAFIICFSEDAIRTIIGRHGTMEFMSQEHFITLVQNSSAMRTAARTYLEAHPDGR